MQHEITPEELIKMEVARYLSGPPITLSDLVDSHTELANNHGSHPKLITDDLNNNFSDELTVGVQLLRSLEKFGYVIVKKG